MVKYYKPADIGIDAVTATTTSSAIPIEGAKKVSFYLQRAAHTSGTTTFTVTGSIDGVNFVTLNNIVSHVTNTNAQTVTRVASVAPSGNATAIASLDLEYFCLKAIKVVATIATDGNGSATVAVEF